jgi:hypothetical protein
VPPADDQLLALCRAIADGDPAVIERRLAAVPDVTAAVREGATRQRASDFFLTPIHHYVYVGDTALHIAAAAYQPPLVRSLLAAGARPGARNRRGAEPLHYAADGGPAPAWGDPAAITGTIDLLVGAGADPDALDKSGVAPLHRAVRSRGTAAVRALLSAGADPLLPNKSGSTPLHLAVQTTGKSNSGSPESIAEQRVIITVLLERGARPTDEDAKGKTVREAAQSAWIVDLLDAAST